MERRSFDSSSTVRWLLQAGSGMALIILLAVHLIVNHWAAPHGLLTYTDVIHYYDLPGVVWMESLFLIVVTIHCLLGIHAIILDLNLNPAITRIFARALIFVGVITIVYGLWLIAIINSL